MTTQPDPTIRERLRELARWHVEIYGIHETRGICHLDRMPWPCDFRLAYLELDTLERRVRAAEAWGRAETKRRIMAYEDPDYDLMEREAGRLATALLLALSEARSLIASSQGATTEGAE